METEPKNINGINNVSDMDQYFKDTTFGSKISDHSNNIDTTTQTRQKLHKSTSTRFKSKQKYIENEESTTKIYLQSKLPNNANIVNNIKATRIASLSKDFSLSACNKENINTNDTRIDISSNKSSLMKHCKEIELSNSNSETMNSVVQSISSGTTSKKLSGIIFSMSGREKSSTLNPSISIVPTQDRCKLASWGLPPNILQKYETRGVRTMFSWQVECLSNHKVLEERRNLVYSAPTSAGKTLVAEILMIKTILERQKKVIFILPFVSVVREKMYYFQDLLSDSGIRVEGFMGGTVPPGGFSATQVGIATIEKANSLVNRLMEENELINLGAVIIDELHLVGDPNRGYLLELLLTKLKYMTFRDENINIQLIGMSATLPNLSLLAEWLDAELYKTDFRPIPLNEQCKIGKNIYDNKLCLIRTLVPMPELTIDSDDVLHLCIETITDGHSVLIFCPTKSWCEKLAEQIASSICRLGRGDTELGKILRQQLNSTLISEALEQLKRCPVGLDDVLRNTVSFGTAFHHAGLTMDERDIIEGSFRSGSIRVLVATSTLSSGVNLPARRVLIRSPMFGGKLLDSLTYKQMIGRAGRMGKDTAGESILICKPSEQKAAQTLLSATLSPIESCLENSGLLIRALLEAIASEVVYTPSDLELYTKCTLVSLSDNHDSKDPLEKAIKFLLDNEFLLSQKSEEGHRWVATSFGKACLAASIPPKEGLFLLEELQKARRCFVLDTELHVVYLVTPLTSGNQIGAIDWMTFLELWKMLSDSERKVGQLVGVEERFLTSAVKGIVKPGKTLNIHKRFYTALALHDLVREIPLNTVCKKYGCCRGLLQSLQQSASTFAGMVTQFCKQLGWDCLELLVSQFQTRLQFGVCRELLDLLRLPMLNGLRARSLYKHGITSVADLASANELDVERALYKALPFESEKEQDGELQSDAAKRNKMRTVFVTGRDGLTPHEAAVILVQEARALVQNELGLQDMTWKSNEQSVVTNGSNSDASLRVQNTVQSIERSSTEIAVETVNNSQAKVGSTENTIPEEHVSDNRNSTNLEPSLFDRNISCHETLETNENVAKNINNNPVSDLESNITERRPSDHTGLTDQLLEINIPGITVNESQKANGSEQEERKSDDSKFMYQLLQIDMPEFIDSVSSKISLDVFEDSSPKMARDSQQNRNSESLISFKESKNCCTRDLTSKHATVDMQNAQSTNGTSKKRIRISDEAAEPHLASFDDDKLPTSRSPSLFNDSLNLDTQICVVLEQNIMDSLHFSEYEDSKLCQHSAAAQNVRDTSIRSSRDVQQTVRVEGHGSLNKAVLNVASTQDRNTAISWRDDSWNESKRITDKLNQIKDMINEEKLIKARIKGKTSVNVKRTIETSEVGNSVQEAERKRPKNYERAIDAVDDLKTVSQKRRFRAASVAQSPVANAISINRKKIASFDSNKSDADDIVIPSQNRNLSPAHDKFQSEFGSEGKPLQAYNEKVVGANSKPTDIQQRKIKPKLRDILNLLDNQNSDEDIPTKPEQAVQASKISSKESRKTPRSRAEAHEITNSIIEMTNWSTLNITKAESDKGGIYSFVGKGSEKSLDKPRIRSVKNVNVRHIVETSEMNNSMQETKWKHCKSSKGPVDSDDDFKKISQRPRFKAVQQSPIANVIAFNRKRIASFDSNNSDTDDIVIGTQNFNSPSTSIKIRSRLDSEGKRTRSAQKIPIQVYDSEKLTGTISKTIDIQQRKIKPKLKDTLPFNLMNSDSSFEGSTTKAKSKTSAKKPRKSSKTRGQAQELVNTANEMTNWNTLNIIKVGSDRGTFNLFKREVMQKRYVSLALSCEIYNNVATSIGAKIVDATNTESRKRSKKTESFVHTDRKLCGAAIAWENNIAYYLSFANEPDLKIPGKEQLKLLKEMLSNALLHVKCFAAKEVFKTLYGCCGIAATCKFLDPKVASWLYNGSTCEKNFNEMVKEYFPSGCFIAKRIGACYDVGPGLNVKSAIPGECRASTEAVLTWHLMDTLIGKLEQQSPTLLYTFKDIEMRSVILLACMELNGVGISLKSLQDLSSIIRKEMTSLEELAYAYAGKRFNFSSSKEVAEILDLYKGKKTSVNKAVLGQSDHPISNLVMAWRKLNVTQSKIVCPILSKAQHEPRIHGNSVTCTLTGRISMHEPNLQNVPKDFSSEDNSFTISVRMAFIPAVGNVMLSADYCQLELRILAHFSKDQTLCNIMRKQGDIFKSIAANWNHVTEDQVDDKMRQHTKQLCYGMIYGMGVRSLAESLSVDEDKAKEFLKSFMNAYPNISTWMNNILQEAQSTGYITTLLERRRMFPGLTSSNPAEKSQAERQAVNTKIQGSAADITKKAMVNIEDRIRFEFPTSTIVMPVINTARKLRSKSRETQQRGGYLILQLHDELLYEVNINDLNKVATIIKESMEHVCQLAVPLPVKLKVGPAWGDLSEYDIAC